MEANEWPGLGLQWFLGRILPCFLFHRRLLSWLAKRTKAPLVKAWAVTTKGHFHHFHFAVYSHLPCPQWKHPTFVLNKQEQASRDLRFCWKKTRNWAPVIGNCSVGPGLSASPRKANPELAFVLEDVIPPPRQQGPGSLSSIQAEEWI